MGPVPELSHCPADREETAEAYLLRSLPLNEVDVFERHYHNCQPCAAVVERVNCILAMERALERLRAQHVARAKRTGT